MKKWWKHSKNSIMRGVLTAACAMLFFVSQKSVCFAEATATVKAPTAYIRKTPDKNSDPVGSTSSGKTVTVISQTTDAAGYVWYEIHVSENVTGYIRSDLVNVDSSSGTIPTSSAAPAQSSEPAESTASGAEILPETGMDEQYATIKAQSAIIRSAASKSKSKVDSLSAGTQVIVSGQTEGSDKTWYYITFTGTNGAEKTGYVRSDLITLGEMVPVEEPQEQEPQEQEPQEQEQQPETTVNRDYELKYEYDEESGGDTWWIYDYTVSSEYAEKQRVQEVLAAVHARSVNADLDAETLSKQRIVIIILIAVIIILAVVMTIMIFKLRDAYYEEYEDDEDEEDEEEEEDRRKKARRKDAEETKRSEGRSSAGKSEGRSERRRDREEREEPVRRKSSPSREERQSAPRKKPAETDRRMPEREVFYEEEAREPVKAAPKKKAKNFMIDDDDFEFEFLNMKNKDKDI